MTPDRIRYQGGPIFDGVRLLKGHALVVEGGRVIALASDEDAPGGDVVDLGGDILSPGFVDLQVNGGGGVMVNDAPTVETLETMAQAHRSLGVTAFLPTLITDAAEVTAAAISAAQDAVNAEIPGIAGLHLEGPHLSAARKGAHDSSLIRPMSSADLDALVRAARSLPVLKVTVAPESVSLDQVKALSNAGVFVSLGHTDAGFDTCMSYAKAGARSATHLFNAMSQLGNRDPGLVGAVLASGALSAGLIADGIHVHPETIRAALAAKTGPGAIYLVSDAMAAAGSDITSFSLNGRTIHRKSGRLTLDDGTLAGADLDLARAVQVMVQDVGMPVETALAMATSVPAKVAGIDGAGRLLVGRPAQLVRLGTDFRLQKPLINM